MIGSGDSPHDIEFLLDESLVPNVAEALRLVGFRFTSVKDVFGKGALDPEIIDWAHDHNAVWVHAD